MPARTAILITLLTVSAAAQNASLPFRIGGPGTDYAKDVVVDSNGNIVLAGYFEGTVDFDAGPGIENRTSNGLVDTVIAKFDKSGRFSWAVSFGSPGVDIPHSVTVDRPGNILVTGYFSATCDFDPGPGTAIRSSRGGRDVYILKLDPDGRFLWVVTFGGPDDDQGYNLKTDAAGNVYVTGFFGGAVDLSGGLGRGEIAGNGDSDAFAASYDAAGAFRWGFSIGGTGADLGTGIALDRAGNVIVTGSFNATIDADPGPGTKTLTSSGGSDVYVAKYDPAGNYIWAIRFGGPQQDSAIPGGIWMDGDQIYLTGNFIGTSDFDPGPAVASRTSRGASDVYVAHYDAQGNYVSAFSFGGPGSDNGHRLTVDSTGAIYVTGWFTGTANFDSGTGSSPLTAAGVNGANDAYVVKFDSRGSLLWARGLGGAPSSGVENQGIGTAVFPDGNGNVIAAGRFFGEFNLAGSVTLTSAGSSDMYLVRFTPDGQIAPAAAGGPVLSAVANAAGGRAGILSPNAYYSLFGSDLGGAGGAISVYDVAGQERPGVVIFTSPGQVNFRTPRDQPLGAAVIKYVREDGAAATLNANTEAADPGILAIAFATGPNAGQRVASDRPARPGDILSAYATGLGAAAASTVVQFGTSRVTPAYAGDAPGLPGVNQVNFTVPASAASGSASVTLAVGDKVSNAVTLVVAAGNAAPLEGTMTVTDRAPIRIHTYVPPAGRGDDVSTHIVELPARLVIIDTQFYMPFAQEVRDYANRLGKPIDRVINSVTETEHWIGNEAFRDLPIYASAGVRATITNMTAAAFAGLRDRFGADVSNVKVNPAFTIAEGAETIDGVRFEFQVIRDATSPEQLVIRIPSARLVFTSDIANNRGHLYVGRRNFDSWIGALNSLKAVSGYDLILPGHLPPGGTELWDLNREYLDFAREALTLSVSWTDYRTRMTGKFPTYRATPLLDFTIRTLYPAVAPSIPLTAGSAAVTNLRASTSDGGRRMIEFDISWENSWRNRINWDAAWSFAKYRPSGGSSAWRHATLSTFAADHQAPNGTVTPSSDGKGIFLYRATEGQGTISWQSVRLVWNSALDGLAANTPVDVQVFGVEMVYIPEGRFLAGDDVSPGRFHAGGNDAAPYEVTADPPRIANAAGGLWATEPSLFFRQVDLDRRLGTTRRARSRHSSPPASAPSTS